HLPAGSSERVTMSIRVQCECGKGLKLRDEGAGKKVRCPACGAAVRAPRPDAEEQPRPRPPAAPADELLVWTGPEGSRPGVVLLTPGDLCTGMEILQRSLDQTARKLKDGEPVETVIKGIGGTMVPIGQIVSVQWDKTHRQVTASFVEEGPLGPEEKGVR